MNNTIRVLHRWLSVVFSLAVLLNIGALAQGVDAPWVGFLALIPLILLQLTGLYLFAPALRRALAGPGLTTGSRPAR